MIILNGTSEFEQFGYAFDLSKQLQDIVIAVSSITKEAKLDKNKNAIVSHRGGVVNIFGLSKQSLITTIKSDRSYSGFGSKINVKKNLKDRIRNYSFKIIFLLKF